MNIKVVYNKKLHKLSSGINTLEDIRGAIKKIYKDKVGEDFNLWVQIDCVTGELYEVQTDHQLQYVKQIYDNNQWPSIKILVRDPFEDSFNQQDLDLLNQSMLNTSKAVKPKQQQQLPNQFQESSQQTEQKQQADVQCHFQPEQFDQSEQTKVDNQHIATQSSVPTKDNGQNPAQNLPQGLFDNKQLEEYIISLIDQRLRNFGLISAEQSHIHLHNAGQVFLELKQEIKVLAPEMFLKELSNVNVIIEELKEFELRLVVVNKGKEPWKNVELRGIAGPLNGFVHQLPTVNPQELQTITIRHTPQKAHALECCDFKLYYLDHEGQMKPFGQKMSFNLTVTKKSEPEALGDSISCQDRKPSEIYKPQQELLSKAKSIKGMFPRAELKDIIDFIRMVGVEQELDELIEQCLLNAKFAQ